MTDSMKVQPLRFAPGPVDGATLTQAFATFQREVLARMDLRYQNNDFGGLGAAGQVLTATADIPNWQATGFPTIATNTVVGNVSGSTERATAITQAQLTGLIDLVTASLSGAVPALPSNAAEFFDGSGNYSVPAYPTGAAPSASIGLSAVPGSAATFMKSDAAPALDQSIAPTWTAGHDFLAGLVSGTGTNEGAGTINVDTAYYVNNVKQPVFAAPITGYGTPTGGSHQASFAAGSITLANLAAAVAQLIIDLKTQKILTT